jgi:hypothetical protein
MLPDISAIAEVFGISLAADIQSHRDLGTRHRTAMRVGDCAENASIHGLRQRSRRFRAARQGKHDKSNPNRSPHHYILLGEIQKIATL